jgi:polyphosphate kinase
LYLKDNVGSHIMQSNGGYRRSTSRGEVVSSQNILYEQAQMAAIVDKIPMEARLRPSKRSSEEKS